MSLDLKGKDILNALSELKGSANLSEIVDHLSTNHKCSKMKLSEVAKSILDAGVTFGVIAQAENKYYTENKSEINEAHNQRSETEPKDADKRKNSRRHEVKSVMSVNELDNSSETIIVPKKKNTRKNDRNTPVSSDEEDEGEICDPEERYLSKFRWKRSRSRSNSKRRNSRRRRK